MVNAEPDHLAVSWASHWYHRPLVVLAAIAFAAVYSRWHVAGEVVDLETCEQKRQASWALGWDCQSSRAARPGRQCLVEHGLAHINVGMSDKQLVPFSSKTLSSREFLYRSIRHSSAALR